MHLLSAISHDSAVVLAQREIAAKTNEIHEQETARHLVADRGADYVLTVKGNQPKLLAACQKLLSGPAGDFAPEHVTLDRGHGRTEQRTTRVAPVTGESAITFPYAAQVFRIRRDVGGLDGQRTTKEIAHCITLADDEARTLALSSGSPFVLLRGLHTEAGLEDAANRIRTRLPTRLRDREDVCQSAEQ